MLDYIGGCSLLLHGVNDGLGNADPLRIFPVVVIALVDVLNLDVFLVSVATLLPLGIRAGLLIRNERMIELDWCMPRLLLRQLTVELWETLF